MRATLAINGLIHTYIRLDKLYMEKLLELCKNNLTYWTIITAKKHVAQKYRHMK